MVFNLLLSLSILISFQLYYSTQLYYKDEQLIRSIISELNQFFINQQYSQDLKDDADRNAMHIIPSSNYCVDSDTYKFYHPDSVMKDINAVRDRYFCLLRQIIKIYAFDNIPFCYHNDSEAIAISFIVPYHKMPLQTTLLLPYYETLLQKFRVGISSLCMFQSYGHISGRSSMSHKDQLINSLDKYLTKLRKMNVSQECINDAQFLPNTYRLFNNKECQMFFQYLLSAEHQQLLQNEGPQFILKMGKETHRGTGIDLLFSDKIMELRQNYSDGRLCGTNAIPLIAQKYISNPYLYKNHKLEIRVYIYIASTYPLILYSYRRALLKRCALPFNKNSQEKAAHICNTAIVKDNINQSNYTKKQEDIEDEEFFIDWNLEDLQDKLIESGMVRDSQWLNEYLYPMMDRQIIYAVRSSSQQWVKDSKFSGFFAVDFVLNDKLETFIVEVNHNPQLLEVTDDRILRNYRMMIDMIEIKMEYMREKYQRIREWILRMIEILRENEGQSIKVN